MAINGLVGQHRMIEIRAVFTPFITSYLYFLYKYFPVYRWHFICTVVLRSLPPQPIILFSFEENFFYIKIKKRLKESKKLKMQSQPRASTNERKDLDFDLHFYRKMTDKPSR